MSNNQHGFVPNKSTTTNLLELSAYITDSFISKSQVDCIYTDFSKAFDKLAHSVILLKLKKTGFPKWFLQWVESYLSGRSYRVRFRNRESRSFNALSGVPQGSHLGPLLFILSVDDISQVLHTSKVLIYADDMKIYSRVNTVHETLLLKADLERFND